MLAKNAAIGESEKPNSAQHRSSSPDSRILLNIVHLGSGSSLYPRIARLGRSGTGRRPWCNRAARRNHSSLRQRKKEEGEAQMNRNAACAAHSQPNWMAWCAKIALPLTTAAVCAGVIVGLVPPPAPAAAAVYGQSAPARQWGVAAGNPRAAIRQLDCRQAWPYYEQSCLHDARQPNGRARMVRLIPMDAANRSVLPPRQHPSKPR